MTTIHVYRITTRCPKDTPWAEVENGIPVHVGEIPHRVQHWLTNGVDFATVSPVVFECIGMMIRQKVVKLPIHVIYHHADGVTIGNKFCTDGDLLKPWAEEGGNAMASIMEAGFTFRYGTTRAEGTNPL